MLIIEEEWKKKEIKHIKSSCVSTSNILTFGVTTPTMYGTKMPVIDVTAPPMPIKIPA